MTTVASARPPGQLDRLNDRMRIDAAFREAVEQAHASYARDRATDLAEAERWGGVAGTTVGIKCLHAHYAWLLAGGDDPVGRWVEAHLHEVRS